MSLINHKKEASKEDITNIISIIYEKNIGIGNNVYCNLVFNKGHAYIKTNYFDIDCMFYCSQENINELKILLGD